MRIGLPICCRNSRGHCIPALCSPARAAVRMGQLPITLLPISLLSVLLVAGCTPQPQTVSPPAKLAQPAQIVAQGLILPAGGIVQLSAAPGDVVASLCVEVGQPVSAGQVLIEMRSGSQIAAELRTLGKRREEAARQRDLAIAAAQQQMSAAELQLERLQAQQAQLTTQADLLKLAEQQVQSAERVLQQLQTISSNPATRDFIGQLEVDRQRSAVGEAQLNYRQQLATQQQSAEELRWATRSAEQQQTAAREQLSAATASQALEIIDLEVEALQQRAATAQITAPTDGVVLAINASVGESSVPLPLIEMANLQQLVCEVEVNELDAAAVRPGQTATIRSRALGEQTLAGKVTRKFKLVGRPQLRSPDPLARVDYRTVIALVELDSASVALAKDWLQLQVEVSIDGAAATTPPPAIPAP